VAFTSRVDEILASDADIVVELVGGVEPSASWIRSALRAGKSVVTANKQVVALHGAELWRLAANQGRQFRFEAAVGGAMPIVRAIADGLAGDRIVRIDAILNGTTNAVLSQMEATGCSFAAALADARARGFAEADPSADVDGDDARAKLAILAGLAFGVRLNPSHIPGHSSAAVTVADIDAARRHGKKIRQIAHAEYDYERATLTAWVAPVPVNEQSIFARTIGASNAAVITGAHCGEIGIFGAGAGGDATAVAVVSDIAAIARDRAAVVPPPALTSTFCILSSSFELQEAV
jgi:homoserine dehydrogenase